MVNLDVGEVPTEHQSELGEMASLLLIPRLQGFQHRFDRQAVMQSKTKVGMTRSATVSPSLRRR